MSRNAGNYENGDFGELSSNPPNSKISQNFAKLAKIMQMILDVGGFGDFWQLHARFLNGNSTLSAIEMFLLKALFTYESKSLRLKSRIDFFLIAKDLTVNIKRSEILPAIAPDHNAISISLTLPNKCPRGPGFWKFNNTLLKDPQYIDKIRYTYTEARKYYGHFTDRRLFWEMIKMEIRSATIMYSKNKSKSIRNREQELIRKLDHLDGTICNNFSSPRIDGVLREYHELKTELQSIYEEKGKQAIFRAKCRWVENGERPTKYFFNLEKPA